MFLENSDSAKGPGIARCPSCDSIAEFEFKAKDYNRKISNEIFNYYRCGRCETLFLSPLPKDLGKFYPPDYYGIYQTEDHLAHDAEMNEGFKIKLIQQYLAPGARIVEIGPSSGGFAVLAKRAGFAVEAIEMSKTCCDFLNQTAKIPTHHSFDEVETLKSLQPADLIALWQVIEHIVDPWKLIQACTEKVIPGGYLIIAAPNPLALQLKLFRGRWTHTDAPRHLCFLPAQLIKKKLDQMGFDTIMLTYTDPGSIAWNKFGWSYSLASLTQNHKRKQIVQNWANVIAEKAKRFEEKEERGTCFTLLAKKRC